MDYRFMMNSEFEGMSQDQILAILYSEFSKGYSTDVGVSLYFYCRMELLEELIGLLREAYQVNPAMGKALSLLELEDLCFSTFDINSSLSSDIKPYRLAQGE